jgi:hypothetical protein
LDTGSGCRLSGCRVSSGFRGTDRDKKIVPVFNGKRYHDGARLQR